MNDVSKPKKTRLIKGVLLKCVDGAWRDGEGCVPSGALIAVGLTHGLQCWKDQDLLDEISEEDGPLPDVDELNALVPKAEWGLGLNDKPRPPWQFNWVVYLFNPETADAYTYLNSTRGAQIAYERLETKFAMMRRLRGNVVPIVRLDNRPMKTSVRTESFGPSSRSSNGGTSGADRNFRLRPTSRSFRLRPAKIRLAQPRSRRRKSRRRRSASR